MNVTQRIHKMRKLTGLALTGSLLAFPFGSCDFGDFTSTSTVTLSGREVVTYLVRTALLSPIEQAINTGIDKLFDNLEDEEDN